MPWKYRVTLRVPEELRVSSGEPQLSLPSPKTAGQHPMGTEICPARGSGTGLPTCAHNDPLKAGLQCPGHCAQGRNCSRSNFLKLCQMPPQDASFLLPRGAPRANVGVPGAQGGVTWMSSAGDLPVWKAECADVGWKVEPGSWVVVWHGWQGGDPSWPLRQDNLSAQSELASGEEGTAGASLCRVEPAGLCRWCAMVSAREDGLAGGRVCGSVARSSHVARQALTPEHPKRPS